MKKKGLREVKYFFVHKLKRLSYMFFAGDVQSAKFINVDSSLVKNMEFMFALSQIKNVDLRCFDTKNVTVWLIYLFIHTLKN